MFEELQTVEQAFLVHSCSIMCTWASIVLCIDCATTVNMSPGMFERAGGRALLAYSCCSVTTKMPTYHFTCASRLSLVFLRIPREHCCCCCCCRRRRCCCCTLLLFLCKYVLSAPSTVDDSGSVCTACAPHVCRLRSWKRWSEHWCMWTT